MAPSQTYRGSVSAKEIYRGNSHKSLDSYVQISCDPTRIIDGLQPHIQPGFMLKYREYLPATQTNSHAPELPEKPEVSVVFQVREPDSSKFKINEGGVRVGVLQSKCIAGVHVEVGRDKLTDERTSAYEPVTPGNAPTYGALNYICQQRLIALQNFNEADKRSSREAAFVVDKALHDSFENPTAMAIRAVYSAKTYTGPHTFQPENLNAYRMQGFAQATPLFMDVPMRAMQRVVQYLASSTSLDSTMHIQAFFDKMASHTELRNYDGSEKAEAALTESLRDALSAFKEKVPGELMKARVDSIAEVLPNITNFAKTAAAEPLAMSALRMMQDKPNFGSIAPFSTQFLIYSHFNNLMSQHMNSRDSFDSVQQQSFAQLYNEMKYNTAPQHENKGYLHLGGSGVDTSLHADTFDGVEDFNLGDDVIGEEPE